MEGQAGIFRSQPLEVLATAVLHFNFISLERVAAKKYGWSH